MPVVAATARRPKQFTKIAYAVVSVILALSALVCSVRPSDPHWIPALCKPRKPDNHASTSFDDNHSRVANGVETDAGSAATALVSSWSTGNRATALTVATPEAVATLFAVPYSSGLAEDRGCSSTFVPIVCTFGPPGGANPNDPIYQIYVSQAAGGWYVSSVKV